MNKKRILISCVLLITIIFIIPFVWRCTRVNLWIEDFEAVSEDYKRIVDILYENYEKEGLTGQICIRIDNSKYEIRFGGRVYSDSNSQASTQFDDSEYEIKYRDKLIYLSKEDKHALERICRTSYKGHYDSAWISENDVIFWIDETKTYGIMYTKNYRKSKKDIKEWYGEIRFRKIKSQWYEIGQFGR